MSFLAGTRKHWAAFRKLGGFGTVRTVNRAGAGPIDLPVPKVFENVSNSHGGKLKRRGRPANHTVFVQQAGFHARFLNLLQLFSRVDLGS
jgi:hypothetical protein